MQNIAISSRLVRSPSATVLQCTSLLNHGIILDLDRSQFSFHQISFPHLVILQECRRFMPVVKTPLKRGREASSDDVCRPIRVHQLQSRVTASVRDVNIFFFK